MTLFVFDIYLLIVGLCIGSFLNVCIYRIPSGKSIITPPSSCPLCGKQLSFIEMIPVVSIIWQKACCAGCGSKISWRYPLVELITGLMFYIIAVKFGFTLITLKMLIMVAVLVVVTFIDIDYQIIPNIIIAPLILIGVAFGYQDMAGSLIGLLAGFCIIAIVVIASRGGMGWGDAKLLAMIGAFLGWHATIYSLFVGSFFGGIVGIMLMLTKKADRKTAIPFGPFLSLGALCWVFFPWWFR